MLHSELRCRGLHRYSGTAGRTSKPFNPLLGETYELICAEKGFRMLAEKARLAHRRLGLCRCLRIASGMASRQLLRMQALLLYRTALLADMWPPRMCR